MTEHKRHFLGDAQAMPSAACTGCGKRVDHASAVDADTMPEPGDATLCIACGHLMIFTDTLALRDPTGTEFLALMADDTVAVALWARAQAAKAMKPPRITFRHQKGKGIV